MDHWTNRFLDEVTVYWDPPVRDGLGGYSWGAPEQISGKWQFSTGRVGPSISYNSTGTLVSAKTSVWLSREPTPGCYLWKGLIADLPLPDNLSEAFQAVSMTMVRSLAEDNYLYKVYLDET